MVTQSTLVQFHLVDYGSQTDHFLTSVLPQVLPIFDPDRMGTTVLPAAKTLADLEHGLRKEPGSWRIVFYDRAEQATAQALLGGTLPSVALAQWERDTQTLLRFYRGHRKNVLLVDRSAVICTPKAFITAIGTHLDLSIAEEIDLQAAPHDVGTVEYALALQAVAQSLTAKRLNGELDASSLPVFEADGFPCDIDACFTSLTDCMHNEAAQDEADVLLLQVKVLEEELKARAKDIEDISRQISRKDTVISDAKDTRVHAQQQHAQQQEVLQAENALILLQLSSMQEELEDHFREATTLKGIKADLEEQLGNRNSRLSSAEDNAKLMVHTAQDNKHKQEDLNQRLQAAEKDLQIKGASLEERDHALAETQHQITQLKEQVQQRDDELQLFLQSTSWRITGPLRRVKDQLTRPKDQEN